MIQRIGKGIAFEAEARDRSFRIKIREYVPYVCTAIHDGGNFRDELKLKTVLSDYERWYEEDPHTADFMSSMPIVLAGQDSRFEHDLNRDPNNWCTSGASAGSVRSPSPRSSALWPNILPTTRSPKP